MHYYYVIMQVNYNDRSQSYRITQGKAFYFADDDNPRHLHRTRISFYIHFTCLNYTKALYTIDIAHFKKKRVHNCHLQNLSLLERTHSLSIQVSRVRFSL